MARRIREERYQPSGVVRLMAEADNWVMVRRPGCVPFTMMRKEWDAMRRAPFVPCCAEPCCSPCCNCGAADRWKPEEVARPAKDGET